jgi:HK97 gp10 family phage protein
MQIELEGLTVLAARLKAMGAEVSGPGAVKAVRAGGHVIRDAMIERAPVLDRKTPGSTSLAPGALRAGIRAGVLKDETPTTAIIGPNAKVAHVARWVEYGHRQVSGGSSAVLAGGRTRGAGKAGVDVPAHPFLRPAFEASVGPAQVAMAESLKMTIEEAVS